MKSCASNKVKVAYHILGMQNGIEGAMIVKRHPGTCKQTVLRVCVFQNFAVDFMDDL